MFYSAALEARLVGHPCPSILFMSNQTNAPFRNMAFLSKFGQNPVNKAPVTMTQRHTRVVSFVLHNRNSIRSQNLNLIFDHAKIPVADRDSAVGIAICYRLDGPGIQFRWARDFQQPSRPFLGPAHFPVQWVPAGSPSQRKSDRGMALTTHPI